VTPEARDQWTELLPGPSGTAALAAAAFLRSLPGDEFLPSAERAAAVNVLAGTSVPVGRGPDVERRLRVELGAFEAGYWALAPSDRLVAWADLSRRGADVARLRELEPGLDVSASVLADPAAEALADLVRVLFVLPPRARAIRRNAWLLDQTAQVEKWHAALVVVQRDAPALIALEPQLRAVLDPGFDLALTAFVDGASTAPTGRLGTHHDLTGFADPSCGYEVDDQEDYGYEIADRARAKKILLGSLMFIVGVPMLCCVWSTFHNRSSHESAVNDSRADSTARRPAPPPATTRDSAPTVRKFTLTEIDEFERYERERTGGRDVRIPPGYSDWIRAGRPSVPTNTKPAAVPVVYFDSATIRECQGYDWTMTGAKPTFYDFWVEAGRPAFAGSHSLVAPPIPPR